MKQLAGKLDLDQSPDAANVAAFLSDADAGVRAFGDEADRRDRQAKRLRQLAEAVKVKRIDEQLSSLLRPRTR